MSVYKSELKQMVTHEVGVRVEDALEGARKELSVLEGRQTGLAEGAKIVEALLGFVDKDVEEGKMDLPTAEVTKRFILRGVHALTNASQNAANLRIAQTGKVQAFTHTVDMISEMASKEKARSEALRAAEAAPPENARDRVIGGAPPAGIKELRLAEAPPPPVTIIATPEVAAPEVDESPKRRGGRKPRAANSR
jgi:hypothetical protein